MLPCITRLFLSILVLPTQHPLFRYTTSLIGPHRTHSTPNTPPPSKTGPSWVAYDIDGKFDNDSSESDLESTSSCYDNVEDNGIGEYILNK